MNCAMFLIFRHVFLYYNITDMEKYISNIYIINRMHIFIQVTFPQDKNDCLLIYPRVCNSSD